MSTFGVVLDACVLIPAPLRDTLLRAASAGMYRLYWTTDILAEVERNLVANNMTTAEGARALIAAMRRAFPEAGVEGYERLVPVMTNDEKDRHVAAAAVASGAQTIVTTNLRHFRPDDLEPFGIEAQSPDRYLEYLLDLDPELMLELLEQQANALINPPMTIDEVVKALAVHAPTFTVRVRGELTNAGLQ